MKQSDHNTLVNCSNWFTWTCSRVRYVLCVSNWKSKSKYFRMNISQALENVVEKFDCKDLSLNEYRRGDGDSDLCRCEREDAKLLLAITEDYPIENNLYSTMKIAKYNRIEDRWDHIRDIRAVKVSNPRNPIYMLHSRDNLMLINEKICMLSGLQLGRSTTEKVKELPGLDSISCLIFRFFPGCWVLFWFLAKRCGNPYIEIEN